MNTMNQKMALCNQLNMNFEEANELFDNESLESMQMARVNGGILPLIGLAILGVKVLGVLASVATIAAGSIAIYQWCVEDDGSTLSENDIKRESQAAKDLGYYMKYTADSIVRPDGTKEFNVMIEITAPTLAQ